MKKLFLASLLFLFVILFTLPIFMIGGMEETETASGGGGGTALISPDVERFRPIVEKYCKIHGLEKLVDVVLALIMQESGGRLLDVMQSSESAGLPPNTITDPDLSIKKGMEHFKRVYDKAKGDIDLTLQAYNFGSYFVDWIQQRGGKYTLELAHEYSRYQAQRQGWSSYGDPEYVPHVRRYLTGDTNYKGNFKKIMDEALKYKGWAYVWAGADPKTGFDCSGLVMYTYRLAGINLPRTAQEQFYGSKRIAEKEISNRLISSDSYKHENKKNEVEFMNVVTVKTYFNGRSSTVEMTVKTQLIDYGDKWKVNDVVVVAVK
ncbi:lysozyme family protein [Bacillus sp. FJAT-53060]|uniref:bifunctional lytic transglycosylase/C40 family peptidase n=1 Tax=Bacillus sp. FJAT-53060 TaxID=3127666 RepID=UPI0030132C76